MIKYTKKKISLFRKNLRLKSFYKKFINKGDVCFDIGANIGSRTEVFSSLGADVVSIEPVEETYLILKNRFKNNNNVTTHQVGIGDKPGQKEMYISDVSEVCTLSELFIEKYHKQDDLEISWHSTRQIEIKTLNQLIEEFGIPVFCKIDVEGYELEVLKGLSQPLPLMSLEYNAKLKGLALECISELSKFESLSFNFSPYESMKFAFKTWKNKAFFISFISELPMNVETGDIYVKYSPN